MEMDTELPQDLPEFRNDAQVSHYENMMAMIYLTGNLGDIATALYVYPSLPRIHDLIHVAEHSSNDALNICSQLILIGFYQSVRSFPYGGYLSLKMSRHRWSHRHSSGQTLTSSSTTTSSKSSLVDHLFSMIPRRQKAQATTYPVKVGVLFSY